LRVSLPAEILFGL